MPDPGSPTARQPQRLAPFSTFLSTHEEGDFNVELTRKVEEIVAALHEAHAERGGKPKATLSIKLDFELDSGAIEIVAEAKAALPKMKRRKSIYWATRDNQLTRENPRQQSLPLHDVTGPRQEARYV